MKRVFLAFGLSVLWSVSCLGQQDSSALSRFAIERSARFARQLANARTYATTHQRPLVFNDDRGNPIHLVGITATGHPIYWSTLNADAALTTNVVALRKGGTLGLNLMGENMMVGVWDGGRVKEHVELGERVIAREGTSADNHSTHVTGTLIATGINPLARGMAPLAKASTHDYFDDEAEMAALAKAGESSLLFSNHSYATVTGWVKNGTIWEWTGDPTINSIEDYRFGFYDERTQAIDQIAFLAPYYSIVWAAGNDRADVGNGSKPADCNGGSGYDCIIPEGVSKNVITVGAVNKVQSYSNPIDVTMSFFSSWGPTDDGRIKPDIVGDGVNLFSLSANGTDTYGTLSGTSMSTPNVTGSLVLLQELYGKIHGGRVMKASTLKALAIHTARETGNFRGPDYQFGWGLLDAGAAANLLVQQNDQSVIVKELSLKTDSVFTLALQPKANQRVTATIVWTDPPGNPTAPAVDPSNLMLINDLDLRVVDDQDREQLPWTLDPANPLKQAIRADNFRDNVEKLEFDFPEQKTYHLTVRHKGTLTGGQQNFSLIVSYQPIVPIVTWYWVGDSGNWSDGTHWSKTSGGSPALSVPGGSDHIIIDENSFGGTGKITLLQDASCGELLWLNSRPSGLELNGKTLTVSSRMAITDADFSIYSAGNIHFSSGGNFIPGGSVMTGATLVFDGSLWELKGNVTADEIRINSGELIIDGGHLELARLTSTTATPGKVLTLSDAFLSLNESSNLNGASLHINSNRSGLHANGIVTLHWQAMDFPGVVMAEPSTVLTIEGNNRLRHLEGRGKILLLGSNEIDTLLIAAGGEMELAPGSVQTLSPATSFDGSSAQFVSIYSTSPSFIQFPQHDKLCFDYMKITQVQVKGKGVINAGTHSLLTGAVNWQQKACEDVLFADFTVQFNCVNSASEFNDRSTGPVTNRSWLVDEEPEATMRKNPAWKFETTGDHHVTLIVSDNAFADSVTKTIKVIPNPLTSNIVVLNSGTLTSLLIASRYQWFNNGEVLPGETQRSYQWNGETGAFHVVSYEGQCNILSDTVVVTGTFATPEEIELYPNPASNTVEIRGTISAGAMVRICEITGRSCWEQTWEQPVTAIPVQHFPNGLYFLEIQSGGRTVRRKIVVQH